MLLIIADMDSIGEFQEELTYYDMESPCFQKSMLSRYGQMVLDILADIGLHKELRPFRQDKGLLMALLADIYQRQYHRGTDGTEGGKRAGNQSVLSVPHFFFSVEYFISILCGAATDDHGL